MPRTTVISGAAMGIGAACARRFAQSGDNVVLLDIDRRSGDSVADEISALGGNAEFIEVNVRSTEACNAGIAKVEARYGQVDVLIANAGVVRRQPLSEMRDEDWHEVIDIDLTGTFRLVRAVSRPMQARRQGAIVCVSSVMGARYGWDERVHYTAAKAGVMGLVAACAVELGKYGVRVNAVAPGLTKTAQSLDALGPDIIKSLEAKIPVGRAAMPHDIAEIIRFLASDKSFFINGQTIVADGGFSLSNYL